MTVASMAQTNVQQAVPFFMVNDIDASLGFYTEGLGFTKTIEWVDDGKLRWCWLEIGGAALMLQAFWKAGNHSNVPTEKLGVGVSIRLVCQDALALYPDFKSTGLAVKRP